MISCIMATGGRPLFLQRAVKYFLRQDISIETEIVIVEDDPPATWEKMRAFDGGRVRHFLVRPMSMGAKLNYAAEQARGDVLVKLDDDDYYAANFLARGSRSGRNRQCGVLVAVPDAVSRRYETAGM